MFSCIAWHPGTACLQVGQQHRHWLPRLVAVPEQRWALSAHLLGDERICTQVLRVIWVDAAHILHEYRDRWEHVTAVSNPEKDLEEGSGQLVGQVMCGRSRGCQRERYEP